MTKGRRLVFGCGYLGQRVAMGWLAAGHEVVVTTRSERRAETLRQAGLVPRIADVTRPETLANLPAAEAVLYGVGYDPQSQAPVTREAIYLDGFRAVLDALPAETGKVIYLSSTGVYGQRDGDWVDEETPCRPLREAGRLFLAAERELANRPIGCRGIVLRLAGLYGPGRLLRMAALRTGEPIEAPIHGHLNLIHVDDAVAAVFAAEQKASLPRTYLVSDGHPTGHREFYCWLAHLLGLPAPRFVEPDSSRPTPRRGGSDKQIRNARLLNELNLVLKYPSYREGLAAIVAQEHEGMN